MSKQAEMVKPQQTMPESAQRQSATIQQVLPAVDVLENDEGIMIVADMPGVEPDAVEVELEGRELTIRGIQTMPDPAGPTREYRRAFTVPQTIAPDRVAAELKSGVLRVELGKSEQAKPRRIQVKSA